MAGSIRGVEVGDWIGPDPPAAGEEMGIESRDYFRETPSGYGYGGGWDISMIPPVCRYIILANIVVFLLQIFFTRAPTPEDARAMLERYLPDAELVEAEWSKNPDDASTGEELSEQGKAQSARKPPSSNREEIGPASEDPPDTEGPVGIPDEVLLEQMNYESLLPSISIVQEWFELRTDLVMRGQIWRLLTCAFCHDRFGIFHILFNMLFLYWFGATLERMYGSREFLFFYLAAAVVASLAFVALDLFTGDNVPAIGASGAVMAVTMLFAIHFPRHTILVMFFIPVEVRILVVLYVIYDLHPVLLTLAGDQTFTGVAHSAHLGGLAFGYLYWRWRLRLEDYWDRLGLGRLRLNRLSGAMSRNLGSRRSIRLHRPSLETESDPIDRRVDEVLQKISDQGRDSLTEEEVEVLESASKLYRERKDS